MDKKQLLLNMNRIAGRLDECGLFKDADDITDLMKRMAQYEPGSLWEAMYERGKQLLNADPDMSEDEFVNEVGRTIPEAQPSQIYDIWQVLIRELDLYDKEEGPEPVTLDNTTVLTWFERDRAHVRLTDKETEQKDILEYWDDDVRELVEAGFLDPKNWHKSMVDYYNYLN